MGYTGTQGNLLFGNFLCRTALRCLQVLMVILSFPKCAHQERASVGTCWRSLPPPGQVCAPAGASQPPRRARGTRRGVDRNTSLTGKPQCAAAFLSGRLDLEPDACDALFPSGLSCASEIKKKKKNSFNQFPLKVGFHFNSQKGKMSLSHVNT